MENIPALSARVESLFRFCVALFVSRSAESERPAEPFFAFSVELLRDKSAT